MPIECCHRERSVAISTTSHEIAALPSVAHNDSQIKHLIFYRQFWAASFGLSNGVVSAKIAYSGQAMDSRDVLRRPFPKVASLKKNERP